MSAHLEEGALEAVAHGRNDLVPDEQRLHVARCPECQGRVVEAREVSRDLTNSLAAEAPEFENLDAMIAQAVAQAPARDYPRPSLATLAGAGVLGVVATATLALLSRPSLTAVVDLARGAFILAGGVDRLVAAFVPGGWGLVAVVGFALVAAVALPLRRLVGAPGARASAVLTVLVAVGVLFPALLGIPAPARALTFEGAWSSPDDGHLVTLAVTGEPLNVALREAAASAGLAYVSQLESDDRRVTLDVQGAELRLVLETLLGDAPVIARRTETALVLVPAGAAEGEGSPPSPAVPEARPPAPPVVLAVPPARTKVPPRALRDRESFGGDLHIRAGEDVRNVTSTGGDVVVEGTVWGTVTSMGGDIEVEDGGVVHGEMITMGGDIEVRAGGAAHGQLVTMGGEVEVEEGAFARGGRFGAPAHRGAHDDTDAAAVTDAAADTEQAAEDHGGFATHRGSWGQRRARGFGGWLEDALRGAASHALLFVFGVLLLALAPARLDALRRTLVRAPFRSVAGGVMGVFGAAVTALVLTVTVLGIPAAVVLVVLSVIGGYVGLLASASVLGAALPSSKLKGKPVLQVGAGVAVLYLASLVPALGSLLTAAAVLAGFGALLLTRFSVVAVGD